MDGDKDIVYSTRIRLARNITSLPFPNKLTGEEKIYSVLMKNVDEACNMFFKTTVYKKSDLEGIEGQAFVEKHLASPNLIENCPYGALIVSKNEDISIMLNEEDHIRAQCIVSGCEFEKAYNNISKVDNEIAKRVEYAVDKDFGYLTACPTNLGSGMRASAMLFLPSLTMIGSINSILRSYQTVGITARGVYGEGSKAEGYMYQVSNQASINLSEKEIIDRISKVVNRLVEAEKIARKNIASSRGIELKDEILRAYGILQFAAKMDSAEFMEMIALTKLGVGLGYIDCDINILNQLLVLSQPAMLCKLANKQLSPIERDITRAALIKRLINKKNE